MIIIGQVRGIDVLAEFFELRLESNITSFDMWNVQPNSHLLALTNLLPKELSGLTYGMPTGTRNTIYYEAPIEWKSTDKVIKKHIIHTVEFRKHIRFNRCIIPCDYFILCNDNIANLYFFEDRSPIGIAGVFNNSANPGCSILTFPAYGIFKTAGNYRVPMILPKRSKRWIGSGRHLIDITELLEPITDKLFNGYPVNYSLVMSGTNTKEVAVQNGHFIKKRNYQLTKLRKGDTRSGIQSIKSYIMLDGNNIDK